MFLTLPLRRRVDEVDVKREAADLIREDGERGRRSNVGHRFVLHDGIEGGGAALDVIRLYREHFAKRICRAVAKERPHFHFAKALAAVLGLAAKRLLGDERVRTDGAHVNLVFHHVMELKNIHVSDGDILCKCFAGAAVEKLHLAVCGESGEGEFFLYLLRRGAREGRHDGLIPKRVRGKAEMHLEYLSQVHAGRDAKRGQNKVDWISVLVVGHVFSRKNAGNDTLVAVASRELIAHRDVAYLRDGNDDFFQDARFERIASFAGEYADSDDTTSFPSFHAKRGVFHIFRLITENGTEEPLFGRELGFAFRRHLANQDVARTDFCTDADHALFVEVLETHFAHIRNVVRRDLRTKLRIAHSAIKVFYVNRREFRVLHESLRHNNGVFVVSARPAHESDTDVLSERHLSAIARRGVGDNVSLLQLIANTNRGALQEGGVLIGLGETLKTILVLLVVFI